MRKLSKSLLIAALVLLVAMMSFGCYVVSGQTMSKVKGTYKLTRYTYTPKHERRAGYTPTTYDYVEGEKYLYEDYLVVTGTNKGYYVHKDASGTVYSKEITLTYEYDDEDGKKVEYVIYNDAVTVNANSGVNRLGVTGGHLGYSKPAIDYTELFTKRKMRTESISVGWTRVSGTTDLSYATAQLDEEPTHYDYESFGVRGLYEPTVPAGTESQYQYFFYVIDPKPNATVATVYYALKETPTVAQMRTAAFAKQGDDWNVIELDGTTWTVDVQYGTYYSGGGDDRIELNLVSRDISDATIQSQIEYRLPTPEP